MDAPIVLHTDTSIADILLKAGDRARKPYKSTPLDFLNPPERRTSIIALCKFGLGVLFGFDEETSERPGRRLPTQEQPHTGALPCERCCTES